MEVTLAAEFYSGAKRKSAMLDIVRIGDGVREYLHSVPVKDKREARKAAANLNAVCWNF